MNAKANVNVNLILIKDNKILLSRRENTGYEDGNWGLVSGNVEVGESAAWAVIREAEEEIGVRIDLKDLVFSHVMHRKSNRENMDIFMTCSRWENEIKNAEPHKCGGLEFFNPDHYPVNLIDHIKVALENVERGNFYSEYGW